MVFQNAISKAEIKDSEEVADRVNKLIDCITYSVFQYTTRGLFECDKLIFSSQMAFQVCNALQLKMCKISLFYLLQILLISEEITTMELDFLLRFPIKPHVTSPVDFLSNTGKLNDSPF